MSAPQIEGARAALAAVAGRIHKGNHSDAPALLAALQEVLDSAEVFWWNNTYGPAGAQVVEDIAKHVG